jgi:hypothetical protein
MHDILYYLATSVLSLSLAPQNMIVACWLAGSLCLSHWQLLFTYCREAGTAINQIFLITE